MTIEFFEFFSAAERFGLSTELVERLNVARVMAGIPFRIASGLRSAAHNAAVGGVEGSEHTANDGGVADGVDIAAADSRERFLIVSACLAAGFKRVGVYDKHVHVGIRASMPQNVLWIGESN